MTRKPLTIGEQILKYPYQVSFPYAGAFHALRWYSSYDRGHILFARTFEQLSALFMSLADRGEIPVSDEHFKIDQYFVGHFVRVPMWFLEVFANSSYLGDIDHVNWWIRDKIQGFVEQFGKYPLGSRKCFKWSPRRVDDDETEKDDPAHYNCDNCDHGIVIEGKTKEDIYLRLVDDYDAEMRASTSGNQLARGHRAESKLEIGRGAIPNEHEPLYAILDRRGDHSDGISFTKVDRNQFFPVNPYLPVGNYLAFVQGELLPTPDALVSFSRSKGEDLRKRYEQRRKAEDDVLEAKYQQELLNVPLLMEKLMS